MTGASPATRPQERAAYDACAAALELDAAVVGFYSSGLPGPKGNRETFVWLTDPAGGHGSRDPAELERMAREVEP